MKDITRKEAIQAMCWECMGHYSDGKESCTSVRCPLYTFMPYKDKDKGPDLWWKKYNPKRSGLVTWEESAREISEEQRQEMVERLQRTRERKAEGCA